MDDDRARATSAHSTPLIRRLRSSLVIHRGTWKGHSQKVKFVSNGVLRRS
jgi:hypothetical protein